MAKRLFRNFCDLHLNHDDACAWIARSNGSLFNEQCTALSASSWKWRPRTGIRRCIFTYSARTRSGQVRERPNQSRLWTTSARRELLNESRGIVTCSASSGVHHSDRVRLWRIEDGSGGATMDKENESLAHFYRWDARIILYNAITKLKGASKLWFRSLGEDISDWDFSYFAHNVVDMHYDLNHRKK